MRFLLLTLLIVATFTNYTCAQKAETEKHQFTEADTLRGMLRHERTCFDVTKYTLNIEVKPAKRFIKGYVDIDYKVVDNFKTLQIDLFENMTINKIVHQKNELTYNRKHNAVFVHFTKEQVKGNNSSIRVYYEGNPITARKAPWDGGFVWKKDANGSDWIGVACEGDGASMWWPNKDHLSDEPNSMTVICTVPANLMCVVNGNLTNTETNENKTKTYTWDVTYPINNYNVSLNIADYVHFSDVYTSKVDGEKLPLDYYVLRENEKKARRQFAQVPGVLEAFEHYFGKYPFWNDGYALVETPYLGMEHQSGIAYGNKYLNGYLGTGGMNSKHIQADYIIVHETGHEYFGNSISCNDHAEMWIHESFTTYMEMLYVEYHHGKELAKWYLGTQKRQIHNRQPILGPLDVNYDGWLSSDHYYKGAYILHTLRSTINNDELWFKTLKALHEENAISHMTSEQIIDFLSERLERDLTVFFKQYLEFPLPPMLHCRFKETKKELQVAYKWETDVPNFTMPALIGPKGDFQRVEATSEDWKIITFKKLEKADFRINTDDFYIQVKR